MSNHDTFSSNNSKSPNTSIYEKDERPIITDSSFSQINYQILDYNIILLNDVLSKIFLLISEATNIKRKYFHINFKFDGPYKKLLVTCVKIIEYLENILPILKITKEKIYRELKEVNENFRNIKEGDINFLISNMFNIFLKLNGNFEWSVEIKRLAKLHTRNSAYVFEIINEQKLEGYGLNETYKDLLLQSDSFEGTPVKKRRLICGEETQLIGKSNILSGNFFNDIFFDVPEIDMTCRSLFDNVESSQNISMSLEIKEFNNQDKPNIFNENIVFSTIGTKSNLSIDKYSKDQEITFTETSSIQLENNAQFISNESFYNSLIEYYKHELNITFLEFKNLPQNVEKIAEASFSEVFRSKNLIYKIIPIGKNCATNLNDFIRESKILKVLSKEKGVSILRNILFVEGKYTENYLKAWDSYGVEINQRPDFYSNDQKFGVLVTEYGGVCLENYRFKTVKEVILVILQITTILSALELKFNFEHRDLHWGNILIYKGNIQLIDFALSRIKYTKNDSPEVIYKDLNEINWIFDGDETEDEQFLIYREMRNVTQGKWSKYCPMTNVLWMKYLISKLFNQVKLKKSAVTKDNYFAILKTCTSINEFSKKL